MRFFIWIALVLVPVRVVIAANCGIVGTLARAHDMEYILEQKTAEMIAPIHETLKDSTEIHFDGRKLDIRIRGHLEFKNFSFDEITGHSEIVPASGTFPDNIIGINKSDGLGALIVMQTAGVNGPESVDELKLAGKLLKFVNLGDRLGWESGIVALVESPWDAGRSLEFFTFKFPGDLRGSAYYDGDMRHKIAPVDRDADLFKVAPKLIRVQTETGIRIFDIFGAEVPI